MVDAGLGFAQQGVGIGRREGVEIGNDQISLIAAIEIDTQIFTLARCTDVVGCEARCGVNQLVAATR